MNDEFNFKKPPIKNYYTNYGIFFGPEAATVSKKAMEILIKNGPWKRLDLYYDFKKSAFAIKQNDKEGMLAISMTRRAFRTKSFSSLAKRGRYKFYKKQGDLYIFIFEKEEIHGK